MWYKDKSQEANNTYIQQIVPSSFNLHRGGHLIHTIIRTKNATRIPQSTTKTKFGSDSEYIASGSILQRANTTGSVGCGSDLYSMSSTTKSGSSSEATTYISGWVQKYSTSPTSSTERDIKHMHRIYQGEGSGLFAVNPILTHARVYFEKWFFLKLFFCNWVGLIHTGSKV